MAPPADLGAGAPIARPGAGSRLLAVVAASIPAVLVYAFLQAESGTSLTVLVAVTVAAALVARRVGVLAPMARAAVDSERLTGIVATLGVLAIVLVLHDDHFALLLLARVLLVIVACLGLHMQFGQAGVVNFAGAAFFGVGGYTAAVLASHGVPHLVVLVAAGFMAAAIGSVLLLPLLRTRGHYAALITIAFGLLFRTFLEVNDSLGGPQGLKLSGFQILGWSFSETRSFGDFEVSLYVWYVLGAYLLVALAFSLVRRLETSWVGLALDAVRLDETAAGCFGIEVPRWKIAAFTLGNFVTGVAGALSAMLVGFIAPNNFTFQESLVFVSIVLLGGLGNAWGVMVASFIVIAVPEKLQAIQEYRFLIFSVVVILVLLFRPAGLVPRPLRRHFGSGA